MLIKCFTTFYNSFKVFEVKTLKNDKNIRKLVVFVCPSSFAWFTCCLLSKIIGEDPKICMKLLRVKKSGHDSLSTTLRVLEEDPRLAKSLPRQCQSTPTNDAQRLNWFPIKWVCGSKLSCGTLSLKLGSLIHKWRSSWRPRHSIDALSLGSSFGVATHYLDMASQGVSREIHPMS